jgi:hypothetical protein
MILKKEFKISGTSLISIGGSVAQKHDKDGRFLYPIPDTTHTRGASSSLLLYRDIMYWYLFYSACVVLLFWLFCLLQVSLLLVYFGDDKQEFHEVTAFQFLHRRRFVIGIRV